MLKESIEANWYFWLGRDLLDHAEEEMATGSQATSKKFLLAISLAKPLDGLLRLSEG